MRDSLKVLEIPSGNSIEFSAPGVLRRIVGVTFAATTGGAGEVVRLAFKFSGSANQTLYVCTGPSPVPQSSICSFALGGAQNINFVTGFTPATGVYSYAVEDVLTGPLPDFWLSGDNKVTLTPSSATGLTAIGTWRIVYEEKLDDQAPAKKVRR
jgi:hypothetical protein